MSQAPTTPSTKPGCLGILARLFAPGPGKASIPGVDAFSLRAALTTPGGHAFYTVLQQVVPAGVVVVPEVSMASLFNVRVKERRRSAFNRIAQKRIDYVLCEQGTFKPLCAIELDDATHQRPDRQARDSFVDDMCRSVGLPLLRYKARSSYDANDIRTRITAALTPRS